MPTYPIVILALLQTGAVLFGGAVSHRSYGEAVWLLLAVPVIWTGLACWIQAYGDGFWSSNWGIYLSGGLIFAGLTYFLGRGLFIVNNSV